MKRFAFWIAALGLFLFIPPAFADWAPAKRITWTSGDSLHPAMKVDHNDRIHIVWDDYSFGNTEILYRRSTDKGGTWSPLKRISWTKGESSSPALAIDSKNGIHVAWSDDTPGDPDIYYVGSPDGGTSWSQTKRLTWTSGVSYRSAIAIDSGGNLYVFWCDLTPGNFELFYKKSSDGGSIWSSAKRITWNAGESSWPAIATDSENTIHVVWYDLTPGNPEIYYKSSTNGGVAWSANKRLTWTAKASYSPALAIDSSDTIHVVWYDYTPYSPEVFHRKNTDGGATWFATRKLTWASNPTYDPAVAIDANKHIHLVWSAYQDFDYEIFYRKSPDGGDTWGAVGRITWNEGESKCPDVSANSFGNPYVVWSDDTPGNYEIYFRKSNS